MFLVADRVSYTYNRRTGAEPEDGERQERNRRDRAKALDQRIERPLHGAGASHEGSEDEGKADRPRKAEKHAPEALEHGDVQSPRRFALARPDLADSLRVEAEEHPELGHPLVEEWLPMDEDERASSTCGHEVGADDRLPDARWRHEDAGIV